MVEGLRVAGRREPLPGEVVTFVEQSILGDLAGPDGVLEYARVWSQCNAGVDEGPAAEAAADQDVHVFAEAHIIEAGFGANRHAFAGDAHLGAHIREARWEFAGDNFAAAFENGDPEAGTSEARRRNAAAIAGADDDDVVMVLSVAKRLGETGYGGRSLMF